jgi:uroporphyrinogen decarboxylase
MNSGSTPSTPRLRLLTALRHEQPDRAPFTWGFGPTAEMAAVLRAHLSPQGVDWDLLHAITDDKVHVAPAYQGPPCAIPGLGMWGIRVRSADYGAGHYDEFTEFPLAGITSPRELDAYAWPDVDWFDYDGLVAALPSDPMRATQFSAGNPFELYCWMTGMEEALANLLTEPALVRHALQHITDFLEARLRRTLAAAAGRMDLVFLADDLGTQQGLLMARETYRSVLQPFHRRLVDAVRQCAPRARCLFHTDGAVFEVIPDLLEAGIDTLEAVQTDAAGMDPARLKRAYGARLSFQGAISVQRLLPRGDIDTVARECRELVAILGAGGGYIPAPSHAIQVGTPPANVIAMLHAVLGDADFDDALRQARTDRQAATP